MKARRRWLGAAVSLVALLGAVAHLVWPGSKIDASMVLLIVVALVPWLGQLLESIELPGGWKVKYRDLQERQNALERTTAEASSTAQAAFGAARGEDLPPTMETVRAFAEEYRQLRKTPRQPARTAELDQLFGRMVTVLPRVPGFDPVQAFGDDEGGIRLAGHAALYGAPRRAPLRLIPCRLRTRPAAADLRHAAAGRAGARAAHPQLASRLRRGRGGRGAVPVVGRPVA
ncbi:hypothetical protein [Amycolatopsis sp. CA-128772]|uniref:hypothetical protein n=1 Tax=Amycolatopsis sp. CA-128772 TaxID=2073159 RepID=UPI001E62CFED|nr:hypothetical protein [Amycolatopsis sp. CA-128772]